MVRALRNRNIESGGKVMATDTRRDDTPNVKVCPFCSKHNPKIREYDYNDGPDGYVWVRCDACGVDWCHPSRELEATDD